MYKDTLQSMGLTAVQAEIYEFLLNNGENKAAKIAKNIKRPRGVVYKGLDELLALALVEKKEKSRQITTYAAEHPTKLEFLLNKKEKDLTKNKKNYLSILPDLSSIYNLIHHKPGIKFYEGEDGIKTVLADTLNSQSEIYTFTDIETIHKNIKQINDDYSKKRISLGIKKKIIVPDTPTSRKFFSKLDPTFTQVKFLAKEYYSFFSAMQIYNDKISYQVFSANDKIGLIIEDKNIYNMHKLFFEYIWQSIKEKEKPAQIQNSPDSPI